MHWGFLNGVENEHLSIGRIGTSGSINFSLFPSLGGQMFTMWLCTRVSTGGFNVSQADNSTYKSFLKNANKL